MTFVNDASTDSTADILATSTIPTKIINTTHNLGKGGGVSVGVMQSQADAILYMDCDLATELEAIDRFISSLQIKTVLMGSRFHKESITNRQFYRSVLSKISRLYLKLVLGTDLNDSQCGFKMFLNDPTIKNIFSNLSIKRYAFDIEFLYESLNTGYKLKDLPITWNERQSKSFSYTFRVSWEIITSAIKLRFF